MIQTDLRSIQPGDRVIVRTIRLLGVRLEIRTVERITTTQIVCVGGDRYRRDTGRRVGRHDQIMTGDAAQSAYASLRADSPTTDS